MSEAGGGAPPAAGPATDPVAAYRFLCLWEPAGPWHLVAIHPDKDEGDPEKTMGGTFGPGEEEQLEEWLLRNNAERSIYFHVNRGRDAGRRHGKLKKTDITEVPWLHVDVDANDPDAAQRERRKVQILGAMRAPPGSIPPPTCVVFSGGGYQAYWRLEEPFRVDGDERRAAQVEAHSRYLGRMLEGDPTHDVNRIMRVPGTVNRLTPKKRRLGRQPALAELVDWYPDRAYPLASIPAEQAAEEMRQAEAGGPPEVDLEGPVVALRDVAEIVERCRAPIGNWLNGLLLTGKHPDDPKRYGSRSEAVFAACCEMARREVDPKVMVAVLLDVRLGISESILDKKGQATRHARRSVRRALWQAHDPRLCRMNDRYTFISGGKVRIVEQVYSAALGHNMLTSQNLADFRACWMNEKVPVPAGPGGKPKQVEAGDWWLGHPKRNQCATMELLPGEEPPPGVYNLWQGWGVEPAAGDWSLMRAHVRDVLCGGDAKLEQYVLRWCAWTFQNPGRAAEVALVLQGGRGVGKGFFGRGLVRAFGQHGMHVSDMEHVAGRFSGHLLDKSLLLCDEAWWAGSLQGEGKLKRLITEETLTLEEKYFGAVKARNCLHLVMLSNEEWVVPAGEMERRFAVIKVGNARQQDHAYFAALDAEQRGGGVAAMMHDLLAMDLAGWHPRQDIPQTDALAQQKERSLRGLDAWWADLLDDGELPEWDEKYKARRACRAKLLVQAAVDHAHRRRWQVPQAAAVGRFLRDRGCERLPDTSTRGWLFPSLAELRRSWAEKVGTEPDWSTEVDWVFREGAPDYGDDW